MKACQKKGRCSKFSITVKLEKAMGIFVARILTSADRSGDLSNLGKGKFPTLPCRSSGDIDKSTAMLLEYDEDLDVLPNRGLQYPLTGAHLPEV